MTAKAHWDRVYEAGDTAEMSWYQARPALSLALIEKSLPDRAAPMIDVGGGASTLVDHLLAAGYSDITVLDLAESAVTAARERVMSAGLPAERVTWLTGDVLTLELPTAHYALWHDRAVFHFLTDPADQQRYVARVRGSVRPDGAVIVATFAADGPPRCSGLEVARYSSEALHAVFGSHFQLVGSRREVHETPAGVAQAFTYCVFRLC